MLDWIMGREKIESLEALQIYKVTELVDLPITLQSEYRFNNLIRTIAWALDIEPDEEDPNPEADTGEVDLIMAKGCSPDLEDEELKVQYEEKINYVYA